MVRSSGGGDNLRLGAVCSAILHLLVATLAIFGLPQLVTRAPEISEPISVELAQLGEKTNPPPRQVEAPKPEEQPAEPPKQETPPEPPKPEPPKPEPPKPAPPAPPPPPPEPEPVPIPLPKPKPPEPPKEQPKPPPDVLKDIRPPAKKPPPPDDFDTLLKSVDKLRQTKTPPPPAPQPQQQAAVSSRTVNSPSNIPSEPVSLSDKDYIAAQFRRCWNFDIGARDAASLIVKIHVLLNSDGSVVRADIADDPRYMSDTYFRSAADSARRAVYTCSPIKLPPGKYDALKDLLLNFDPRDAVR